MADTKPRIGRFQISALLADSVRASVYDAIDTADRKPVTIRVTRVSAGGNRKTRTTGFDHPGLMKVLSYDDDQGTPIALLERFDGKPLDARLPPGQKMPPVEAIALLRQLASALDYAHGAGAIHGGLNPSAILLNDKREAKLLDLDPAETGAMNASPEQLLRSVQFLSPERIRDVAMDGRSDQFSLAVLAYRLFTGDVPYTGTPAGIMLRIAYQGLERGDMRDLTPEAQDIFRRALSKKPAERYDTCAAMIDALEPVMAPQGRRTIAAEKARTTPALATAAFTPAPVVPSHQTPPPFAQPAAQEPSWKERYLTGDALKYFGGTFLVCVIVLVGVLYFMTPSKTKVEQKPEVKIEDPVIQKKATTAAPAAVTKKSLPPVRRKASSAPVPVDEPLPGVKVVIKDTGK